jgi:hypothetical protein
LKAADMKRFSFLSIVLIALAEGDLGLSARTQHAWKAA